MIGETLGRYVIAGEIGRGGMGVVYRARDPLLNREIAIKVLSESPTIGTVGREHLLHEARAASALNHPNICIIHEVGEQDGRFFIVMELIDGKPLSEVISPLGIAFEVVTRYGVQIAEALAHAHQRGIVHRDLKSSNVVITADGRVKVLDFGLARFVETNEPDNATQSIASIADATGLTGTLPYMSPEQFRGEHPDHRADIWALGVILYEAASGQAPFRGSTPFELGAAVINDPPPPLPNNIPAGLSAIIQRCLAKDPAVRYQRASDVSAALEAIQIAAIVTSKAPSGQKAPPTVLRSVHHINVSRREALLLVGTTKGAFLLRASPSRSRWEAGGPYFHGDAVFALAFDGRAGRHRLWASTHSILWGTVLRSSDDFGKTWRTPEEAPIRFPAGSGISLKNIWQIAIGRDDQPETLYCGVDPAALFESSDGGESWSLARGLFDHPHRPRWMPGNGGLILHTILCDPANASRMYAGISAGGVYRTDDAGETWQARNKGIRVTFSPEKYPEFGQCVHKFAFHPARPERLFLQNHWGLYRSDNSGESWEDIAHGVPSDFGFPVLIHPQDPDCVYVVPVESDEFRCTPEGQLRVYRTRNSGGTWEALSRGLPQRNSYETVLRDAMAADSFDPTGIYFGTRSGRLYGSRDDGRSWELILEGLPPIVCVKAAFYGSASDGKPRKIEPSPGPASARSKKTRVAAKSKTKSRR
ncbi:MAG TPA: protein kinase [Candidatus Acidoferrales bacterium]|nr:protein kinase [Candidatus Acidoferrales bacterium]